MDLATTAGAIRRIAMLGNHLPRQCGIATFTTYLTDAIEAEFPALECIVLAMNDAGRRHAYPARVRFEIEQNDIASYRRAADFLNVNMVTRSTSSDELGCSVGVVTKYTRRPSRPSRRRR